MAKLGIAAHTKTTERQKADYYQIVLMPSEVVLAEADTKEEAEELLYQQDYEPESLIVYPVYPSHDGYTVYF